MSVPRHAAVDASYRASCRRIARLALVAGLVLHSGGTGAASAGEPLAPPTGEVLLVVTGDISLPNVGTEAHLDRDHLNALPRVRFTTATPFSDVGTRAFEGVRLDTLLEAVGAGSWRFEARGADDFKAIVDDVDFARYPVIVADTVDELPLTVRTLGPLRIMFPFDDHPTLLGDATLAMAVWQLVGMDVR